MTRLKPRKLRGDMILKVSLFDWFTSESRDEENFAELFKWNFVDAFVAGYLPEGKYTHVRIPRRADRYANAVILGHRSFLKFLRDRMCEYTTCPERTKARIKEYRDKMMEDVDSETTMYFSEAADLEFHLKENFYRRKLEREEGLANMDPQEICNYLELGHKLKLNFNDGYKPLIVS